MKSDYELNSALDNVLYKYERLGGLLSIMQQFTAECVDITGAPENAVSDSLFEIELGLREANKELKEIICQGKVIRKESKQELKTA